MSTLTTDATPVPTRQMTAEELLLMPRGRMRYELVEGELRQMSPAGYEHGAVGMNLATALAQHIRDHRLGQVFLAETGFIIARNPDTVRAPDAAFVRSERLPTDRPKGYFPGAPDLAVEVVSPGDTVYEVEDKVAAWLAAGAQAVWVVNPQRRSVTMHRASGNVTALGENDELSGEDIVPGFRLRVHAIFD